MDNIRNVDSTRGHSSVNRLQNLKEVLRRFVDGSTSTVCAKIAKEVTPKTITKEQSESLLAILAEEMGHIPPHVEAENLAPQASELRKELYAALIYQAPKAAQKLCSESSPLDPEIKATMNRLYYSLLVSSRS